MKKLILFFTIQFAVFATLIGQQEVPSQATTSFQKDNAWELGLHGGHFFSNGNIKFIPGYGGGISIRRALDYAFALRLDLMYGAAKGEDDGNTRNFSNQWMSGSLQGILSLNNLRWNLGERKTNIYALGGFGLNTFTTDLEDQNVVQKYKNKSAIHSDLGVGIAFRINQRLNFALEHKATIVFGEKSDWIDGVQTFVTTEERSTFKDVLHYSSVRLNINLGNLNNKTEPLYWINPLEGVVNDIQRLRDARVSLADADADGVIDVLDEEESTAAGAIVNSKGVTLDSDGDRIPDYQDKEPYSDPGYKVDAQGVAQKPDPLSEMRKYVDEKLRSYQPANPVPTAPTGVANVYLPSIYYPQGGFKLAGLHLGTLSSVAHIIKSNPSLRFVVIGHTDEKGTDAFNDGLSYKRANAVIESLTSKFGINRSQLILNYQGKRELLLPGFAEANRRVEFRVANAETEMATPGN